MSNPAVIVLNSLINSKAKFKRFQIEDNIGESIHLHFDNFRVDFTIEEFLYFSKIIKGSLDELNLFFNDSVDSYDPQFLEKCCNFLSDLIEIKIEEIKLSKLYCIVHSNYGSEMNFMKKVSLEKTPAYRYLTGNKEYFISYRQFNYFETNNEERLLKLLELIKTNAYPDSDQYIVLFNGQNIIRDGQHRAAILAHLYGLNKTIKVKRFYFKNKKHFISPLKDNLKIFVHVMLKKTYRKFKTIIKKFLINVCFF